MAFQDISIANDRIVLTQVLVRPTNMTAYTINLNPVFDMTDEQFYQLCRSNPGLKFERSPKRELIIICFDSSTCFRLPGGGDRSPDLAWIRQDRWDSLTPDQKAKFPPIAPDFVLELTSPTDSLKETQAKMQEYMTSGVKLGWLIHCKTCRVEIYRLGQPVEILDSPATLSGEEVLPGFVLELKTVW
jgi:Putative restriction endonuclease